MRVRCARASGAAVALVPAIAFVVVLAAYLLPRPAALRLFGQGGAVEIVELAFYAAAAWLLLRDRRLEAATKGWILVALGLLVAFEINPGGLIERAVEITPDNPGDPAGIRWVGILVLSLLGGAVGAGLFLSARRSFLRALSAGRADAWLALAGLVLVPAAFVVDRYHATHYAWNRGYRLVEGVAFASHVIEETAELLVPVCFVLALWIRTRAAGGDREEGG